MQEVILGKTKVEIKEKFIEHYKELLKDDYDEFMKYSLSFLRRSIRVNTLKVSIEELKKRIVDWNLEQIPWCKEGFWIEHKKKERRDVGNITEHVLGYFYVQEAVSMIPPIVLEPKPGELVLDMCAAPGSKASQIAQYMKNKGILIANDYKGIRLSPLGINMQRMGISNCILSLMEGRFFKDFEFDRILVDAPCSGTGTIRKSLKTLKIWNENMIRRLSGTQKQLIKKGFENLKKGGILVYSTCSVEPEENEEVVDYLLSEFDNAELMDIKLDIKRSDVFLEYGGKKYNDEVKKCLRLWPQDNDTEGFFVAKVRKI